MAGRLRTNLLFALMCWIWGSTWLAIRFGLEGVPPFIGAAMRMGIAGVLLVLIAVIVRTPWPRGRTYVVHVIVQGVTLFGLQFAFIYWAEQTVPSGLVAVLFAVTPLVTSFFAAVVFRIERLWAVNVLGLVAGFCGVAVIFWSEVVSAAHASAAGALAVLAASTVASIGTTFAKRYSPDVPPLATVGPGQIIGALVLGTIALATERSASVHFTTASAIALAYLTVFGSGIAFLTFFTLVRTMPVTRLTLLTYITPIVAVLLGLVVAHEQIAPTTFLGVAVVFTGIGLVHLKPAATKVHAEA